MDNDAHTRAPAEAPDTEELTNMEVADLLSGLIQASGMSLRAYAREVLKRDERLVRRWLKDEVDIPLAVGDWVIAEADKSAEEADDALA